jgi:Fe-S-cluster-containing dehydrogenase component/DMSO reductase anchor subunit
MSTPAAAHSRSDALLSLAPAGEMTLIDQLLAEQRQLTAVERFSQKHARADFPAQARYYRDLIPLSKPAPGQQYAFAVDLDKCTGCKACVSACHSLNGLEDEETWRDVGTLFGHQAQKPYQQTVTTACHHCAEPGCLEGCPVAAYDKDAETGIVHHLDDQCIGCQYCTMKCPYDVPKYSERLGIVRKCDMCHERLAVGEAPACVQACPHEAITIQFVDVAEVTAAAQPGAQMLPGAYDSSYTKPTTRYTSKRPIPANALPADAFALHLEHPHWPLIIMLVLTQLAVGMFAAQAALALTGSHAFDYASFGLAALGFGALNLGLFAAVFHLGRPMGAWRFFLGLRTSWMSREILAFSALPGAAIVAAAAAWFLPATWMAAAAAVGAAFMGFVAIFTSVMIYVDTRRAYWKPSLTAPKFYGAALTLGAASVPLVLVASTFVQPADFSVAIRISAALAALLQGALFIWELAHDRRALRDPAAPTHASSRIIYELLPADSRLRLALVGLSLVLWLTLIIAPAAAFAAAPLALGLAVLAQVAERYTFFSAVVALRMPRGI